MHILNFLFYRAQAFIHLSGGYATEYSLSVVLDDPFFFAVILILLFPGVTSIAILNTPSIVTFVLVMSLSLTNTVEPGSAYPVISTKIGPYTSFEFANGNV